MKIAAVRKLSQSLETSPVKSLEIYLGQICLPFTSNKEEMIRFGELNQYQRQLAKFGTHTVIYYYYLFTDLLN